VRAARGERSPSTDEALATLFEIYSYPLYAFLRNRGHTREDAEDLTQAFFAQLLEKGTLRHADSDRGKFRAFLLTALKNFAANEHDRQMAYKRNPGTPVLSLEVETAEGRFQIEPPTDETPEKVFDRRWALTLLNRAVVRLREEWTRQGKAQQFELLKAYITGESTRGGYKEIAQTLGTSEGAVRASVVRLRARFGQLVREEIAHTVSDPADIDDEIRYLLSAVGAPESRPHPPAKPPRRDPES
jgi:RNA polymerase sigma-70 factor (ECF subfamily)